MFRHVLGLAVALYAGAAFAGDQAQYAPPGSWVKPAEIPQPSADNTTDVQILLADFQSKFGDDGDDFYEEIAERIQTPQGLEKVGSVVLEWRPDIEDLIIHKLHIIRDSKIIDVLADGQKFLVLRRENNLELAMLDGSLTAAIQPEGLQVGDILDVAFTQQMRDPLFKGHSQLFMRNPGMGPIRRLNIREIWPASKSLQWRQTEGLSPAKLTDTTYGKELTIAMEDTQTVKLPRDAPIRFSHVNRLEVSEFGSWADVSALMAPLYDKAARLAPASPIKAEAAKIAATSPDPKVRVAAALHLVQDKVRYLFLGMDRGGYIPADADRTWTRRFGDCKGKTALLLAVLHELGIEAEPAMVNSFDGDGLDALLPMARAFDHVLVRATIGGKTYWLDGTRAGDRGLDDIAVPGFHWALPIQQADATLEKLVQKPFDKPETVTDLHLDASKGLDVPAPAHAQQLLRGDDAIAVKLALGGKSPADTETFLRRFWTEQYDWIDIKHVDFAFDAGTGEAKLSMDGTAKVDWKVYRGTAARQYRVNGSSLGWKADYSREPGPHRDAPFVVRFPFYVSSSETVVLPNQGAGFTIDGADVDKVAGGYKFKRNSRIENGVFTMTASTQSVATELPAADTMAAKTALSGLSDFTVFIHAPISGQSDEPASPSDPHRAGADVMIAQAAEARANGDVEKALTKIDEALRLAPNDLQSRGMRLELLLSQGKDAAALEDADKLVALFPQNAITHDARGMVLTALERRGEAIIEYNAALAIRPDAGSYIRRAAARGFDDKDGMISDLDRASTLDPYNPGIYQLRARVYMSRYDYASAQKALDAELRYTPNDIEALRRRALVYAGLHNYDGAIEELDLLLAERPDSADLLMERCRYKVARGSHLDDAMADCVRAARLAPQSDDILIATAFADQRLGRLDDAMKVYNAVIDRRSHGAVVHFGRGLAEIAAGAVDRGKADLMVARKVDSDIDLELGPYVQIPERYRADNAEMKRLQATAPAELNNSEAEDSPADRSTKKVRRKPLSLVTPVYPDIAEDYQIEGYVDFVFVVRTDGSVAEPKVEREYPEMQGFADAAIKVFPKWKFIPETVNGSPVAAPAYYRVSFKLR